MKINIHCEKMEITDPIRDYVTSKLDGLEKFINTEVENLLAEVTVGKFTNHHNKGDYFKAEVKLDTPAKNFFVEVEKDDLYAAIDEMHDILKRDLIKHKEVLIDKNHKVEGLKNL